MNWFTRLFGLNSSSGAPDDDRSGHGSLVVHSVEPGPDRGGKAGMPRFVGLANEAEDNDFGSHDQILQRRRLGRAFPLSQPISDLRQFAGRRDLLENVIRAIEDRRLHVVLYGDRGIGKTSLLHIVTLLAQQARYIVRYTSCSASSTFDGTFRAIAHDIPLLFHGKADPTSERVESGQTLADLLGPDTLTPGSLSEVLEGLSGTRLLIVLDEFDRSESAQFRQEIAELIKNLSDRGSRVQILIGGVAENLNELIRHIPSIRRNLLGIPVGKMKSQEIEEIIRNGEAGCGLTFDESGRRQVVEAAIGSPYIANLIAYQASSNAIDRRSAIIQSIDVVGGIAHAAAELSLRLDDPATAQLAALVKGAERNDLRAALQYALDHFGHVPIKQFPTLLAAAKAAGHESEWISQDGTFRFLDDSIPLVAWLTTSAQDEFASLSAA